MSEIFIYETSMSQSSFHSHSLPTSSLQERTQLATTFIQKQINGYGAWKRRTRNTQTVRAINCWGFNRAPGRRIL